MDGFSQFLFNVLAWNKPFPYKRNLTVFKKRYSLRAVAKNGNY